MYAIIRLENGTYYTSMVFGYFCKIIEQKDEYQKCLQSIHNRYFLVLNPEKTALVRQYIFPSKSKYLDPTVIITDNSEDDWTEHENGEGIVKFLSGFPWENVESVISEKELKQCIALDSAYHYEEYPTIHTQKDIDNLMDATGEFHDAYIDKCQEQEDGSLYLLMKGVWGCSVEIWFSGDVSYCTESRNPEYWYGSSVIQKDGFIYFIDESDTTVEEITPEYTWFKAKNMKYHIIPNKTFAR